MTNHSLGNNGTSIMRQSLRTMSRHLNLEEYDDLDDAMGEIASILAKSGEEVGKTLSLTWLADDPKNDGHLAGDALIQAARKHLCRPGVPRTI